MQRHQLAHDAACSLNEADSGSHFVSFPDDSRNWNILNLDTNQIASPSEPREQQAYSPGAIQSPPSSPPSIYPMSPLSSSCFSAGNPRDESLDASGIDTWDSSVVDNVQLLELPADLALLKPEDLAMLTTTSLRQETQQHTSHCQEKVKKEIQKKIRTKRLRNGQSLLTLDECTNPPQPNKLTPSDINRKERRKASNRRAAAKCRLKKKAQEDDLKEAATRYKEENVRLTRQVQQYREHCAFLQREVLKHKKLCPGSFPDIHFSEAGAPITRYDSIHQGRPAAAFPDVHGTPCLHDGVGMDQSVPYFSHQ